MNRCDENTEVAVPPGTRRVLVPRRTSMVRRRDPQPRTHGRTGKSVVAVSYSWSIRAKGDSSSPARGG
jgi:hypothetical protein